MKTSTKLFAGAFIASVSATSLQAAETIKIAFIDPLSGPFASIGASGLQQLKYATDVLINKKGGVLDGQKFEIVPYDNKTSPKESLIQLKRAIGEGVRFVMQGSGSGPANALTDAIKKHNKRNPENRVLYLNYSAVDPALTNRKCNFWHFRFDAHADMKMNALTDVIKENSGIKKVYLIGQDYSFGKAVAASAKKFLGMKRPDIKIVGNELHPIGKVKDFTPYATKIRASEADAVVTGNWGADMVGLAKAIGETGLDIPVYTYYASHSGITKTIGAKGKNKIRLVHEGPVNPPRTEAYVAYAKGFKAKNPEKDLSQFRITNTIQMLAAAMTKAGSDKPIDVANALEGMEFTTLNGEKVSMGASDHQLIQPIHISVHTDENISIDADNSGYGLLVESSVASENTILPTTCKMKRPKS